MDTQAIAARLTAIAELMKNPVEQRYHVYLSAIGFLLAHVETLTQQVAELTAEQTRALLLGPVITQLQRERDGATAQGKVYKERALQAEQQRDAAHAALKELRIDANRLCDRNLGGTYEDDCRRSIAKADAALAASAPQKEK